MISPDRFAGAYRVIDITRKTAIVVLFAFIIVSMGLQIVLRTLEWTDEILRYLNIWVVFLGAGLAVPKSGHLHVGFVADKIGGPRGQQTVRAVRLGIIIAGLLVMAVAGAIKTASQAGVQAQMAPMSIAWFYLAIPVGCLLMAIDYSLILLYGQHPFAGNKDDGEGSAC
ncbi:MAG: TRAP transporter small permease subunit [Phycisphaerae bacterium]|nr:TRAP transporter small permease subunit [Phycisphaerae bacterium]